MKYIIALLFCFLSVSVMAVESDIKPISVDKTQEKVPAKVSKTEGQKNKAKFLGKKIKQRLSKVK